MTPAQLDELLQAKFVDVPEATRSHVAGADPEDLRRWGQRVLTAQTLADVFAGRDSQAG